MLKRKRALTRAVTKIGWMEPLEDRCLLSANHQGGGGGDDHRARGGFGGNNGSTITFAQAPTAVQTGLDTLATTDGVTAPTTTQTVVLGNTNGVETYTVDITGTGTDTKLTVDQNGNAVTAATKSSTTFGAITNTAVTGELTTIAAALNLTAPTSTTAVTVTTASDGTSTYSLSLSAAPVTTTTAAGSASSKKKNKKNSGSTTSTVSSAGHYGTTTITVDSNGNPVGNESVPLSTLSTAIQSGLTGNAPSGATALASTSLISVRTINGVTFYSATYTSSGTRTTVTVDTTGTLKSLPSTSTTTYSAIPSATQAELQTLATANGVTTAIATTQTVTAYDEANGTTIYSVRLAATGTSSSGSTYTFPLTISVDEDGNPTVAPVSTSAAVGYC